MEMVPHDKLMQAVKYYCKHGSLPNFWDYLGDHGSYHMQWNAWEMSIEAARKVDLLLSPYAEILLKAWKYQQG